MKIFFAISVLVIATVFAFNVSNAQNNVGFQWQRVFGSPQTDFATSIAKTNDGGFIVAASTYAGPSFDAWIIKFNATGGTEWARSYGGTGDDYPKKIIQTRDGGYAFLATSNSSNGDVIGNKGSTDAWVVKLSPTGNILWQRALGGSSDETAVSLTEASDGGIVIGAETISTNGDITGKATTDADIWVVKLNATGSSIVWQKVLGGTSSEWFRDFRSVAEGGYICGGSTSSVNGDFIADGNGFKNFLVRLDNNGNKLFAKKIFDTDNSIGNVAIPATGGGYYLAGKNSNSKAYIVKTNANGDMQWNNQYDIPLDTAQTIYQLCFSADKKNLFFVGQSVPFGGIPGRSWIGEVDTTTGYLNWYKAYPGAGSSWLRDIIIHTDGFPIMIGNVAKTIGANTYAKDDILLLKYGATNNIKGTVFFDSNRNGIRDAGESNFNDAEIKIQKEVLALAARTYNGSFSIDVDTGSYTTTVQPSRSYYNIVPAGKNSSFPTFSNIDSFSFAVQPIAGKSDISISIVPLNVARPGFNMSYRLYYSNNGTDTLANGEIMFKKDSRLNFVSSMPVQTYLNGDTLKWSYSNLKPLDTASILINLKLSSPPVLNLNDTILSVANITPVADDLDPADDTAYLAQRVQGSYDPNDKSENLAGRVSQQEISQHAYLSYLIRFQNTGTDTAFTVTVRDTLDDKLDWSSLQMMAASHSYQLNIKSQNQLTWSFNNIHLVDSIRNEAASHGFIAYRIKPKNTLVIGDVIKNTASIYFDYNLPVKTNTQETEVVQFSINNPQIRIPFISSFIPVIAASGETVTINGINLMGATAVTFGGVAVTSFVINSATSISAVVGNGLSGEVKVITPGGVATLTGFTYIAAPTITSFTPTSGGSGTSVTITGTNFTGATGVSFGGTNATSFIVNSATSITAVVGTGASGTVSVTTPGGTGTRAGFTYTVVTAIDPIPARLLGIHLYPNPTSGSFTIDTLKLVDQWETLEILDARGKQKLLSVNIRSKTTVSVSLKHFSSGLYIALLRRKNGRPTSIKFVKQ